MKLLNGRRAGTGRGRGGRSRTCGDVEEVLHNIWRRAEMPCGKRLVGMLADWLPWYGSHFGEVPEEVLEKVRGISPATVDRMLAKRKVANGRRRGLPPRNSAVKAAVEDQADEIEDEIEDEIVDAEHNAPASRLNDLHRTLIRTARFLVPQRDVLTAAAKRLYPGTPDCLLFPPEIAQDAIRYVEDLSATRDHCGLMQEDNSQNVSQLNRRMLILSIAGCVFLPLTFVAGLLGMNVSGIPAAESPFAFAVVLHLDARRCSGLGILDGP